MDRADPQKENTLQEQPFSPGIESQKMKQDMQNFREEILKLKAHTDEVRKKTLLSIQEGIQKATNDGLHLTLFPKFKQAKVMAQATNDKEEIKNIATGQDAVAATEKIVAQSAQNINPVYKAVQNTANAVTAGQAAANQAGEEVQKELVKSQQKVDASLAASSAAVNTAMSQSQKVVSDLVNAPKAKAAVAKGSGPSSRK